jgi:hypothetical protein
VDDEGGGDESGDAFVSGSVRGPVVRSGLAEIEERLRAQEAALGVTLTGDTVEVSLVDPFTGEPGGTFRVRVEEWERSAGRAPGPALASGRPALAAGVAPRVEAAGDAIDEGGAPGSLPSASVATVRLADGGPGRVDGGLPPEAFAVSFSTQMERILGVRETERRRRESHQPGWAEEWRST